MDINSDKFKDNNFFALSLKQNKDENIFASASNLESSLAQVENPITSAVRMNDYDSKILENNAYQDIPDEMLRIEHKISVLEKTFSKINSDTEAMSSYAQHSQVKENLARKEAIEAELKALKKRYSELGFSANISGKIASVVNFTSSTKNTVFSKTKDFLAKKFFFKVSKKSNYCHEMKDALAKLSSINSNVDELITLQVPYGETVDRYDKLTAYLNRANVIHSQISKNLKEMK